MCEFEPEEPLLLWLFWAGAGNALSPADSKLDQAPSKISKQPGVSFT